VIGLTSDLLRGSAPTSGFSSAPPLHSLPTTGHLLKTKWSPGEPCQAMFSDGQWYPATVQSAAPNGQYRVLFEHYAVPLALPPQSLLPSSRSAAAEGYVGVPAPKRLRLDEASAPAKPQRKLEIKETDDEKTRERKHRLNKLLKSKQRLIEKEHDQQQRAQSWQSFRANKSGKQKTGFLTKVSDQSMFAVPEGGRVGFTGSGKAPAPVVEKRKHEFAAAQQDDRE
jgi:survival-of-motor-neuron-related-splicing factor 30